MAAQALGRRNRKYGKAPVLRAIRARLDDPNWKPRIEHRRSIQGPDMPAAWFSPGALADHHCTQCYGSGICTSEGGWKQHICACVYRAIARRCAHEYMRVELIPSPIPRRRMGVVYDMPRHEWAADFWSLLHATLMHPHLEIWISTRLFQMRSEVIQERLRLDKASIFHKLYQADRDIGKAVVWLQPYPLWPPSQYRG